MSRGFPRGWRPSNPGASDSFRLEWGHADAYADAAMDSVVELSQWSRREGPPDRASYLKKALERAEATARGTAAHRYGFGRDAEQQLICGVVLHPWRGQQSAVPNDAQLLRVDESPDLEVGCWCRTTLTGNGYATEAVSAIIDHAFRDLGAITLWVRVSLRNVPSRRVAERLAFIEVERTEFPSSPEWGEAATVLTMRRDATRKPA